MTPTEDRRKDPTPWSAIERRVSEHSYAMVEDLVSKWGLLDDMTRDPGSWIEMLQALTLSKAGE